MYENEGSSEGTESGASEGSSPEASPESSQKESGAGQSSASTEQKQDTTPFHEHPRFKELVEQKNEATRRHQEMETRYRQLEQQIGALKESQPKSPSETDQLLSDLKNVDPRLARVIENQIKAAEMANTVKSQFENFQKQSQESQQRQTFETAVSRIRSLHESNKVSDFGKQFIEGQLDLAYRNGKLNVSDLKAVEGMYTDAHKAIKTYEESLRRDTTKSYVADKTKDAKTPVSLPKGAQAKPTQKAPVFKDKEAMRAEIVKAYLKSAASQKEATNT